MKKNYAPYGMCKIHDVPLEVLFQYPFCPICEDIKREACRTEAAIAMEADESDDDETDDDDQWPWNMG